MNIWGRVILAVELLNNGFLPLPLFGE